MIRTRVDEIREASRNTQGVRIIRLSDNERVVDVAKVAERDEENAGASEPPEGEAGEESTDADGATDAAEGPVTEGPMTEGPTEEEAGEGAAEGDTC